MVTKSSTIYELEITSLSPEEAELTTAILDLLGVVAIEEVQNGLVIYDQDEAYIQKTSERLVDHASWIDATQLKIGTRPNENWNKSWEASFKPIQIDKFCTIKASFHEIEIETDHVITIDPEMAFGTGHHETTYAVIQMMKTIDFQRKTVMDFGTGTGILAILAEKLGAASILAFDYDEVAIECARRCITLNKCRQIECVTAQIDEISNHLLYDVILANINRSVLMNSVMDLVKRQPIGGQLLLSGILSKDFELISKKYIKAGYTLIDQIENGDWLCLRMKKV